MTASPMQAICLGLACRYILVVVCGEKVVLDEMMRGQFPATESSTQMHEDRCKSNIES